MALRIRDNQDMTDRWSALRQSCREAVAEAVVIYSLSVKFNAFSKRQKLEEIWQGLSHLAPKLSSAKETEPKYRQTLISSYPWTTATSTYIMCDGALPLH